MEEFSIGEALGWLTGACYLIAVLNFPAKRIYRSKVSALPADSGFKKFYTGLMRFLARYHRYFGMAAGVFAIVHVILQLTYRWVSYTGLAAAFLMLATAIMGVMIAYGHKGGVLKVHRPVAISVFVIAIIHMITKI